MIVNNQGQASQPFRITMCLTKSFHVTGATWSLVRHTRIEPKHWWTQDWIFGLSASNDDRGYLGRAEASDLWDVVFQIDHKSFPLAYLGRIVVRPFDLPSSS